MKQINTKSNENFDGIWCLGSQGWEKALQRLERAQDTHVIEPAKVEERAHLDPLIRLGNQAAVDGSEKLEPQLEA